MKLIKTVGLPKEAYGCVVVITRKQLSRLRFHDIGIATERCRSSVTSDLCEFVEITK